MAFAVREIGYGRGGDKLGVSFPYGKSRISDDGRLLKRRTAAALEFSTSVWMETATNIEFRYANCAKACAFNMSSKHSTVVKTELLFRSTRTFQPLAGARRLSKRFSRWQSTLHRAKRPKMPCARLNRSSGGLLD